MKLQDLGVDLEKEDDAARFLGVTLDCDASTGLLEMKQTGLIKQVIKALGLDDGYAKGKHTPAKTKALVKDADGEVAHGRFSYSSVVGMLLYLSVHTHPNIAYAVNCCARYMFCPKRSHELALKRIGRYLKATRDRGLVLNPTKELKITFACLALEISRSNCESIFQRNSGSTESPRRWAPGNWPNMRGNRFSL
jgi:hypothetical protein